ncbi:beta-1,4-glucuronyltransferase 1-like isoform X2 [Epargyreus clarus]|uniref:beta-1,4-glucuronyltransferase 1-like isoform X2 n=1 Tax=Epargyreus clarus TaxID=520877 RepID=UPI003C2F9645
MTRCLRIFGAYSYRLTRRHSTFTLTAIFTITLVVIIHLYHYKRQDHPQAASRIGDYEYRPGAFLKGRQPNENRSYCEFNYGLPDKLKWETIPVYSSPEIGNKSPYRVIYSAIQGTAYINHSRYDAVTYVTQSTPEFIYHISEIARYWDGPISLSVFVPGYDLDIAIQIMKHLCKCYARMSKVSLHLFYPKRHPPQVRSPDQLIVLTTDTPTTTTNITTQEMLRRKLENYRNLDNRTRAQYIQWVRKRKVERMMMGLNRKPSSAPILQFEDCSGMDNFDIPTFRREKNMIYPINVGRNVARNASRTNYFIVSDIEMVPSDGLAPKFLTMVRKLMGNKKRDEGCIFAKTVFVVPLFEVERGEEIPRDKDTLVRMVATNRAMYFHQRVCSHCQRFPGLQTWLLRSSPKVVEPMLIARREYPYHRWEPLYFGTQKEPWYSEMLSWEGRQDKMTQMLELCLQEYRMVVLDGAFLCHAAVPKNGSRHNRAEHLNNRRYMTIIGALKKKYPDKPQCKVMWGC